MPTPGLCHIGRHAIRTTKHGNSINHAMLEGTHPTTGASRRGEQRPLSIERLTCERDSLVSRTRRTVRNARKVALVPASSVNTGPVAQSTHDGIILWVNDTLCVILHRLSGTRHRRVECFQSCKAWCHLSCRLFHLMAFPRTEQFRAICSAMLCDDEI